VLVATVATVVTVTCTSTEVTVASGNNGNSDHLLCDVLSVHDRTRDQNPALFCGF
jgi:hypothetical protein